MNSFVSRHRGSIVRLHVFVMVLLWPAAGFSAEPSGPVQVSVLDLSGRLQSGGLVRADLASSIRIEAEGRSIDIAPSEVIWLAVDAGLQSPVVAAPLFAAAAGSGESQPDAPIWAEVRFGDGQVVVGQPAAAADEEALSLKHALLGSLAFDLSRLSRLLIRSGPSPAARGAEPSLRVEPGPLDVLVLANGDALRGIVRSIGPRRVEVELPSGGPVRLPTRSVRIVRFANVTWPESVSASQPARQPAAWLHLGSGEVIKVRGAVLDGRRREGRFLLQAGPKTVPLAEVIGIEPVSESRQWLSTMRPSRYEHRPLLGPRLKWRADATALGGKIRCGGRRVLRGVGVPSGSDLHYPLGGRWSRLIVWPLLDDSAGRIGRCKAEIVVDGRPRWSGTVKAGRWPSAVVLDLAGARDLLLRVEPAEGADILDRFVWAWAVLVK